MVHAMTMDSVPGRLVCEGRTESPPRGFCIAMHLFLPSYILNSCRWCHFRSQQLESLCFDPNLEVRRPNCQK